MQTHFLISFALAIVLLPAGSGCEKKASVTQAESLPPERAFLPAAEGIVVYLDLAKIRSTSQADSLDLVLKAPSLRRIVEDLLPPLSLTNSDPIRRCALAIPIHGVDPRTMAFTATLSSDTSWNPSVLKNWASAHHRAVSVEQNQDVLLYHVGGGNLGYWPKERRLLWATGAWSDFPNQVILRTAKTLAHPQWSMAELATDGAVRFAAYLPLDLREKLRAQGHGIALGSILRLAGTLDLSPTPSARLTFHLANSSDARTLADSLASFRDEAQNHPDTLLLGLGPHAESVRISAEGAHVSLSLALTHTELKDLLKKVVYRVSSF